jgi:hypothetical protein
MSLRTRLFDQIWLKLFSVILATLIWLAVWANLRNEPVLKQTHTFFSRPILVLTDPSERQTFSLMPDRATVAVRGPADLLQAMKEEDISVFVRVDPKQLTGDLPVQVHVPAGASASVTPLTALIRTAPPKSLAQP